MRILGKACVWCRINKGNSCRMLPWGLPKALGGQARPKLLHMYHKRLQRTYLCHYRDIWKMGKN